MTCDVEATRADRTGQVGTGQWMGLLFVDTKKREQDCSSCAVCVHAADSIVAEGGRDRPRPKFYLFTNRTYFFENGPIGQNWNFSPEF